MWWFFPPFGNPRDEIWHLYTVLIFEVRLSISFNILGPLIYFFPWTICYILCLFFLLDWNALSYWLLRVLYLLWWLVLCLFSFLYVDSFCYTDDFVVFSFQLLSGQSIRFFFYGFWILVKKRPLSLFLVLLVLFLCLNLIFTLNFILGYI